MKTLNLVIKTQDFLNIIQELKQNFNHEEFIDILEFIEIKKLRITLIGNEYLDLLYNELYDKNYSLDNLKFINRFIDKNSDYITNEEYIELLDKLSVYSNTSTLKEILEENILFDFDNEYILYCLETHYSIRKVHSLAELIEVGFVISSSSNTPSELIKLISKYSINLIFDEGVIASMDLLREPFNSRKKEIIHHLHVLESEMPAINADQVYGYRQVGDRLSVDCSPERDRATVSSILTAKLNGQDLNCELHTKMKKIGDRPPDRIYFCPRVPPQICSEFGEKVYVYKITRHA